jgi:hypothetical protein
VSKKDRHREKLRRKELVVAAFVAPAEYVQDVQMFGRRHETWKRDAALFVVPVPEPDDSPEVAAALTLRKEASLEGRCPACDACASFTSATDIHVLHEVDCVASDESLRELGFGNA